MNKKVMELLNLAYLVHDKTDFCVFISFSGHVNTIEIDIRKSKKNWQHEIAKCSIDLKYGKEERLNQAIETLKAFLEDENGGIPYDYLSVVERIETDYKF